MGARLTLHKTGWVLKGMLWGLIAILMLTFVATSSKVHESWCGLEIVATVGFGAFFLYFIAVLMIVYGLLKISYILMILLPPNDKELEEEFAFARNRSSSSPSSSYSNPASLPVVSPLAANEGVEPPSQSGGIDFEAGTTTESTPTPHHPSSVLPSKPVFSPPTSLKKAVGVVVDGGSVILYLLFGFTLLLLTKDVRRNMNSQGEAMEEVLMDRPGVAVICLIGVIVATALEGVSLMPGEFKKHIREEDMTPRRRLTTHITGYLGVISRSMIFVILFVFVLGVLFTSKNVSTIMSRFQTHWTGTLILSFLTLGCASYSTHVWLSLPYKLYPLSGFAVAE